MSTSLVRIATRAIMLLLVVMSVIWAWHQWTAHASTEGPTSTPPSAAFHPTKAQLDAMRIVSVSRVAFQDLVPADGSIGFDEDHQTPVFSPYSGRVTRVLAKPGEIVQRGAPLFAIDASEFVQAQSDLTTTKAALTTASSVEQRQHALYESGAAALKDWRQAQADLTTTRAAYVAVRSRLHILGKSDPEIDALELGGPVKAEAIVAAPISGTVIQRQVGVGQYIAGVAAGGATTPQFLLGDTRTMWLIANVREEMSAALRIGQPVTVRVLAVPNRVFRAKVAWVGAALDGATHRLPVRAEVQNTDGQLKAGMFATFELATSDRLLALAVPEAAVIYDGDASRVFVAHDDGSIDARTIHTARHQDGMVEVVAGLHANDKVVTSGALFLDRATTSD